jgi:hypothetical protein
VPCWSVGGHRRALAVGARFPDRRKLAPGADFRTALHQAKADVAAADAAIGDLSPQTKLQQPLIQQHAAEVEAAENRPAVSRRFPSTVGRRLHRDLSGSPARQFPQLVSHARQAMVNVTVEADGRVRSYPHGEMLERELLPSVAAMLAGRSGKSDGSFMIDFGIRQRRCRSSPTLTCSGQPRHAGEAQEQESHHRRYCNRARQAGERVRKLLRLPDPATHPVGRCRRCARTIDIQKADAYDSRVPTRSGKTSVSRCWIKPACNEPTATSKTAAGRPIVGEPVDRAEVPPDPGPAQISNEGVPEGAGDGQHPYRGLLRCEATPKPCCSRPTGCYAKAGTRMCFKRPTLAYYPAIPPA